MVEARNHHPAPGALRQIDAGLLNVGYAEAGPGDGPAAVLLYGWPYDIHSYADVAPRLASAGYRVVVPYLRGFGTTRFLSEATFRNGEQAALALDVIALMDALQIEGAILAGFDWGARTAGIVAALWPERCTGLVAVSGYLIGSQNAGKLPLPPEAELQWWNGAPHPDPSAYAGKSSGPYSHRTIEGGIGHNPPLEAPEAFAKALIEVDAD
jgi:pimeloyl-ACP methyl ester carboxylesterase